MMVPIENQQNNTLIIIRLKVITIEFRNYKSFTKILLIANQKCRRKDTKIKILCLILFLNNLKVLSTFCLNQ